MLTLSLDRGRATIVATTDRRHDEGIDVRAGRRHTAGATPAGGPIAAVLGRSLPVRHPLVPTLVAQLEEFIRAVRGEPPSELGTAEDGLAVMSAIAAAVASIADGGRSVPVPRSVKA